MMMMNDNDEGWYDDNDNDNDSDGDDDDDDDDDDNNAIIWLFINKNRVSKKYRRHQLFTQQKRSLQIP